MNVCYSALRTGRVCAMYMYIEDLVLFIYSAQPSCKFHWLLGLYAQHLTGTPSSPSSARLPIQLKLSQC